MAFTAYCLACGKGFPASRATAVFCGGTCRKRFNRALQKWKEKESATIKSTLEQKPDITILIAAICRSVQALTDAVGQSYLFDDAKMALEYPLDQLNELVNPLCQDCGEKPANGWENPEYCRACEARIFEFVCLQCEKRHPSVRPDDMLCSTCDRAAVGRPS